MAGSKNKLLIKGKQFVEDFTALNSSNKETLEVLKKVGLSPSIFNNWKHRTQEDGTLKVNAETFDKLIDVSGLSYDDYFIEKIVYKTEKKKTPKIRQTQMKNGVVVTTYIKTESKSEETQKNSMRNELKLKISSFKDHMVIYRKLLGLSTSDMETLYGISNYGNIEKGDEVLSVSTYFLISSIFMAVYGRLPNSPLKNGFIDLASSYNDICINIIYFGAANKKKGGK